MAWPYLVLLLAALGLVVLRIYLKLRGAQKSRAETWDEQMVGRLRAQGYAPFNDYPVDFFLALPDEAACQAVDARLAGEFQVDARPVAEDPELRFSLHARKRMRLVVPDVQDVSRRLMALATEHRGRYDGWAAGRAPVAAAAPSRAAAALAGVATGRVSGAADLQVILKRFETPDETRDFTLGRFELVHLPGMSVGRATYQPGWRWSAHVGAALGQARCCTEHAGLVLAGAASAEFEDGHVIELRPGHLFYIPPLPHDSRVLGDEPYVSLHFVGAEKYARQQRP